MFDNNDMLDYALNNVYHDTSNDYMLDDEYGETDEYFERLATKKMNNEQKLNYAVKKINDLCHTFNKNKNIDAEELYKQISTIEFSIIKLCMKKVREDHGFYVHRGEPLEVQIRNFEKELKKGYELQEKLFGKSKSKLNIEEITTALSKKYCEEEYFKAINDYPPNYQPEEFAIEGLLLSFSRSEIADTLEKNSRFLHDKDEIEKMIQAVAHDSASYNILYSAPNRGTKCDEKFFNLAKHAIEVNENYTEHNEKLAIRDLFKAGFSRDEIFDTLEKYSPVSLRDKDLVEKNIQLVEKNMKNTRGR